MMEVRLFMKVPSKFSGEFLPDGHNFHRHHRATKTTLVLYALE